VTDVVTTPVTIPGSIPLTLVGDSAAVCTGDFCALPDHHEQAVVKSRLDEELL